MHLLRTIFWVLLAVVVALFTVRNWTPVTLNLWDDIQADIKMPVLLLIFFLIGFLPTWLWMRTRLWTCRRRVDALERSRTTPISAVPVAESEEVAQ